jgi:putative flippase GtrA
MSNSTFPPFAGDPDEDAPQLEIVVPVYNEAEQLAESIIALRSFLDRSFPLTTVVTVADNASTDDTWTIATGLAASLPGVRAVHLDQKGRGRALRAIWSASRSPIVAYMDVDLATDLGALLPLVAPLLSGHSDVAIGTRLAPGAHVVRGARREIISRSYNLLLRLALGASCSDAQCGFKALRQEAVAAVLPLVEDQAWFFDTEVLMTAERLGLRIHEVPVDWVDDLDSRVAVAHTAWLDLCGVARMMGPHARRRATLAREFLPRPLGHGPEAHVPPASGRVRPTGPTEEPAVAEEVFADELLHFAGVGLVSTLTYVVLFALLQPWLGVYAANLVAIVACGLGNTAAHRSLAGSARHGVERLEVGAALLGVSIGFTTVALLVTRGFGLVGLAPEVVAVTLANLAAAAIRFSLLRTWVFRPQFGSHLSHVGPASSPAPFGDAPTGPSAPVTSDRIPTRTSR